MPVTPLKLSELWCFVEVMSHSSRPPSVLNVFPVWRKTLSGDARTSRRVMTINLCQSSGGLVLLHWLYLLAIAEVDIGKVRLGYRMPGST